MAFRGGINIVIYTLTGNYKADQGPRAGSAGAAGPVSFFGYHAPRFEPSPQRGEGFPCFILKA